MSARILPLPRGVAWPLPRDFMTSLVFWGAYIVLLCSYCTLYQIVVDRVAPNVPGTIAHVCKNWGVWLLTTPVVFAAFRKYASHWIAGKHPKAIEMVGFGLIVIVASAAVPVAIDLLTGQRDAATSLMIIVPRYMAVMGVVYLVWHAFMREHPKLAVDAARAANSEQERTPPSEPEPPATLLVSKGADQCLIHISRIECASAAGNYVEIIERGQRYLMRATLRQVEDMLPTADFIRIHRSHLVRRDEIERIKSQPSGNGTVHLRGGQVLPLSKKHRQELQRYRLAE